MQNREASFTLIWYRSKFSTPLYHSEEPCWQNEYRAILQSLLLDGTGIDPVTYSVAQNVRTGRFPIPPTYIITGNRDTKVPHRQSLDVVEAYKSVGANVEYHEIEGLDHRFDEEEKYEMATLYEFVKKTIWDYGHVGYYK